MAATNFGPVVGSMLTSLGSGLGDRVAGNFARVIVLASLGCAGVLPVAAWAQPVGAAARLDRWEASRVRLAQLFPRPPGVIPDDDPLPLTRVQDSSGLVLRIDRLENQLRALTGQIEQMQFQQRKLEDSLRKFQQDVDFRLTESGAKPGLRPPGPRRVDGGTVEPQPPLVVPVAPGRSGRGDAFDPALQPNAPGAPRQIGTLPQRPGAVPGAVIASPPRDLPFPSGPLDGGEPDDLNAPLQIDKGRTPVAEPGLPNPVPPLLPPPNLQAVVPPLANQPRDDYDLGISLYKQGQYETSESSLRAFLQKNPRDRLVPDAIFTLGETFFQRQRHREAAEQFLKLSTDYAKSPRAPDGLVRLGMSLNQLAAKEQACATFGEVPRKYPAASTAIRRAAQEAKRAGC